MNRKEEFVEAADLITQGETIGGVLHIKTIGQDYVIFNAGEDCFEIGGLEIDNPEDAEILASLLNAWAKGKR